MYQHVDFTCFCTNSFLLCYTLFHHVMWLATQYNVFHCICTNLMPPLDPMKSKTGAKNIHLKMLSATGRTTLAVHSFCPPPVNRDVIKTKRWIRVSSVAEGVNMIAQRRWWSYSHNPCRQEGHLKCSTITLPQVCWSVVIQWGNSAALPLRSWGG